MVIPTRYGFATNFKDGLALTSEGYIDKTGKIVIGKKHGALSFSEGLAIIKPVNGKVGYMNKAGEIVIEQKFFDGKDFSEGLAAIQVRKKHFKDSFDYLMEFQVFGEIPYREVWGYIDKKAKVVIEPIFDWADEFSEGLAAVWVEGKMGYIDKNGKLAIQPIFEKGDYTTMNSDYSYALRPSFSDGMAMIYKQIPRTGPNDD
jgi:hypothetical protein